MKIKAVALQFLVMLIGMAKGFITMKLMVSLGHEPYAMLSQFMVLATFSVQLFIINFDAPFMARMAEDESPSAAYTAVVHLLLVNFAVAMLLVGWLKRPLAEWIWNDSQYAGNVSLLVIYVFLLSLNLLTLLCYQAKRRFECYAGFQIMQQILQVAAVVLGVVWRNTGLLIAMLILGECFLLGYAQFRRIHPVFNGINPVAAWCWLKVNSGMALSLFGSFLMIWVLSNGGRFAVVHGLGLKDLAVYAATFSIAVLAGLPINPLCSVFFPYFCRTKGQDDREAIKAMATGQLALLVMGGFAGIGLIGLGSLLVSWLASPDLYAGVYFVLSICIAQLFYGQARLLSLYLAVNGKPLAGQMAFSLGVLVFIPCAYWGVRQWGALGAGFAMMLAMLVAALMLWRYAPMPRGVLSQKYTLPACWLLTFVVLVLMAVLSLSAPLDVVSGTSVVLILYAGLLWLVLCKEPLLNQLTKRLKEKFNA